MNARAMKFVHTGDWQIGMRAAHVGEAGPRVREERLAAARRVVDAARGAGADFLLVAGDTFEDNGVERALVQRVADVLGAFGGPVYVLPGNHDPLGPASVWEHPAFRHAGGAVHVLREERPVAVPGGWLYPCPAREKHRATDPTAWIRAHDADGVRVGVAHGTVVGVVHEEAEFPIARDAADRAGVDYLALGHWHSTTVYPGRDGAPRMAYAGTHEPTRFGERDSGHALVVEIAGKGAAPVVQQVPTGGLAWRVVEDELRAADDLARVRRAVESLPDPHATLLRVRLTGFLAAGAHDELLRLADVIESRFLYGRLDAAAVRPSPTDEGWLAGIPPGILREAAARLQALADAAYAGPRPEGATPEAAAWALLELHELAAARETDA